MTPRPYRDDLDRIPRGSQLIRRISAQWVDWAELDAAGNPHVTSQAMQLLDAQRAARLGCPGPGMSLIVVALADPLDVLIQRYDVANGEGLAYIDEAAIRCSGQLGIDLWPTADEPAHAVVFRFDGQKKMPGSVKTALAEYARAHLIVPPRPEAP